MVICFFSVHFLSHSTCRLVLWQRLTLQGSGGAAFHQERQLPEFKVMWYQNQSSIDAQIALSCGFQSIYQLRHSVYVNSRRLCAAETSIWLTILNNQIVGESKLICHIKFSSWQPQNYVSMFISLLSYNWSRLRKQWYVPEVQKKLRTVPY